MHTFPSTTPLSLVFSKRFSTVCLWALCWAGVGVEAQAQTKKKPTPAAEVFEVHEEMEALREHTYIYTDGNGHYLAFPLQLDPEDLGTKRANGHYPRLMFWGDGSAFFEQRIFSGDGEFKKPGTLDQTPGAFPDASLVYYVNFWEPRAHSNLESLATRRKDEALHVVCGEARKKTFLQPVPKEEAKALLEKAKFYKPRFMRLPHFLARDNKGTYYYIDKSAKEGEKDFRLFIGKSGQMKRTKLKNIVRDSAGEIFSTPSGSLRFVIDASEVLWIQGKKQEALVRMDSFVLMNGVPYNSANLRLVFTELGLYAQQKIGTPCEDL